MAQPSVAIIGAGQAGLQVAVSLREQHYEGRIALIGDEPHVPYARPPLSKAYLLGEAGDLALRPQTYFAQHRIDLIAGKRAVAIDRTRRMVGLDDESVIEYDHLVLATGARNRSLPIPGVELGNVFLLRTLDEAALLRERMAAAKNVVVIGAGFIGLEFAATATKLGANVTVLDVADRPMARALSKTMSAVFTREHEKTGVRLMFNTQAMRLLGEQCVTAVETVDGKILPADLVLIGIGVIPNVEVAATCNLTVENGIVVDEFLQTSDPHISSIGDVAAFSNRHLGGGRVRLESVQNASDQARCVAARIMGQPDAYDAVPWFWSTQGSLKLQMAGLPSSGCEEVVRGDPNASKCSVFLFRDGKLACVETHNRPADHMLARRLLAERAALTPDQAADPTFDLKSLLPRPAARVAAA
ncbi:oxidoreductase [Steroidobacter agaridevorans]|uniref:Oxidoreductase n=1 Tax=Steroidobacter agaridevorans TaxID=2695856 RepID=A0A829Y9W6_9GAMM|nr:FAD-dependent oxidoreductase [Steroidobacter agaridevorans]GFE79835.1 oxidoreductase [Steroidobacter agaridevorans]GFE90196.1 oxidoreductase [Steroidobacter agaridevorans]